MTPSKKESYSISELASEFDISQRTIRFYEEKDLLSPSRTDGNQRVYTKRDRARLKLILRGKRFGYSLEEIAEILGMNDEELNELDQLELAVEYGERRLKAIHEDMKEILLLKKDLTVFMKRLQKRLGDLKKQVSPKKERKR